MPDQISLLTCLALVGGALLGGTVAGFFIAGALIRTAENCATFTVSYDEQREVKIMELEARNRLLEHELEHAKARCRSLKGWLTRMRKGK